MKRAKKNNSIKINKKILASALFIFIAAFLLVLWLGGIFSSGENEGFVKSTDSQRINLLLVGLDPDGERSDFLAIASYNDHTKKVDILTIPENTKMFTGGRYQKISAAHAIYKNGKAKGIAGTVEALSRLTAIPLNYYIEFSTEEFADFVNALGGIEFDITENMTYRDKAQKLNINLAKGYQRLNGKRSTHLLRYKSYEEGSQKRTVAQQDFMLALAEQRLTPEYIAKLPELFKALGLKTNLKPEDVLKYSNILLNLSADDLTFHILPGHQEEAGTTYWIPDIEAQKKLTSEIFGYDSENITIDK